MNTSSSDLNLQLSIERWMAIHAMAMLVATFLFLVLDHLLPLVLVSALSFTFFFVSHHAHWRPFGVLGGLANIVTWFRLLTLLAIVLFHAHIPLMGIGIAALIVTAADGLDGFLARKFNTTSLLGAYFDKETDACFVLLSGCLIFHLERLEWWVLIPGMLRYIYFLLIRHLKPVKQKEGRSFKGQAIAVVLMLSLVACFLVARPIYAPTMSVAIILVFYSFAEEFALILKGK